MAHLGQEHNKKTQQAHPKDHIDKTAIHNIGQILAYDQDGNPNQGKKDLPLDKVHAVTKALLGNDGTRTVKHHKSNTHQSKSNEQED
jgi:hypothetical protein